MDVRTEDANDEALGWRWRLEPGVALAGAVTRLTVVLAADVRRE
jgi:hypothetical protein